MSRSAPHITGAELKILKVVWKLGTATVRDVKEALARHGDETPAYTTVMTLMGQLAGKKVFDVDRTRQPFVYRPTLRREKVLSQRLKQFLNTVFDGQAGELVLHLVEEANLTSEDIQRIEEKIEKLEKEGERARRKEKKGR